MGTGPHSSSLEVLRQVAEAQGVEPSDDDLEAVRGFLDAILPALARLEEELEPETGP
jgi:hypothetical protein